MSWPIEPWREDFESAFSDNSSGCVRTCSCGKAYYHNDPQGYDWEDNEFSRLEADENAFALDYAVGELSFEGGTYVLACDCWEPRAKKIYSFITSHGHSVAELINLVKARAIKDANALPEVKEKP